MNAQDTSIVAIILSLIVPVIIGNLFQTSRERQSRKVDAMSQMVERALAVNKEEVEALRNIYNDTKAELLTEKENEAKYISENNALRTELAAVRAELAVARADLDICKKQLGRPGF